MDHLILYLDQQGNEPMSKSYHLTLVNINTQDSFELDVVHQSAREAQTLAESEHKGFRVTRILCNSSIDTDGILGGF